VKISPPLGVLVTLCFPSAQTCVSIVRLLLQHAINRLQFPESVVVAVSDDSLRRDFPIGIMKCCDVDIVLASLLIQVAVAVMLVRLRRDGIHTGADLFSLKELIPLSTQRAVWSSATGRCCSWDCSCQRIRCSLCEFAMVAHDVACAKASFSSAVAASVRLGVPM